MLTPMQIRDKRFQSAGRNSYKSDDVDVFFDSVSESYEQMFKENAELVKRVSLLAERLDQYKKDEDSIKSAVITAQKAANKIELEAKERAELLVKESEDILAAAKAEIDIIKKDTGDGIRAEMAQTLENAESEADTLIEAAKKKAAEIILEAEDAAKNVQGAANRTVTSESILFEMLKKEVSEFKNDLLARYKTHIELISQLPELAGQMAQEESQAASVGDEKETDAQPLTHGDEDKAPEFEDTESDIEFIESKDEPPEGVLSLEEFINEGAKGYESEVQRVAEKEEAVEDSEIPRIAEKEELVEDVEIPFDRSADKLEFIKEKEDSAAALDVNDFISSFEEAEPREDVEEKPAAETIFDSRITTGFKLKKPVFNTDKTEDTGGGPEQTADGEDTAPDGDKSLFSDDKNENLKKRFSAIRLNDAAADATNADVGGDGDGDGGDGEDDDEPPSLRKLFKRKK